MNNKLTVTSGTYLTVIHGKVDGRRILMFRHDFVGAFMESFEFMKATSERVKVGLLH